MTMRTTIEWADFNWIPLTGCTPVSEGCANCYAAELSGMQARIANAAIENDEDPGDHAYYLPVINNRRFNGTINLIEDRIEDPYDLEEPSKIFLSSMSDVFHEDVPLSFLRRLFEVMYDCQRHSFQVLTKRPERAAELAGEFEWPSNIWLGTSIEGPRVLHRIDALRQTPAAVQFLSVEPMLHAIPDLPLDGIEWVICGGESGRGARPMKAQWARDIRDQCVSSGVPYFFKQWGCLRSNPDANDPTAKENGGKVKGGCVLDGEVWQQFPFVLPQRFQRKIEVQDGFWGELF